MIVEKLFLWVVSFMQWLVGLLPNIPFAKSMIEGQTSLWTVIGGVSCIFPLDTVITIIGLIFILYGVEFLWGVINWLIKKIPTID